MYVDGKLSIYILKVAVWANLGLRKGYYMDGKMITEFIEKFNLPNEFVITDYEDTLYGKARAFGVNNCESGIYPIYNEEYVIGMYYCDSEICELLKRFDGVVFSHGDLYLCDDSWDGFQPIVTLENIYKVKDDGIGGIF